MSRGCRNNANRSRLADSVHAGWSKNSLNQVNAYRAARFNSRKRASILDRVKWLASTQLKSVNYVSLLLIDAGPTVQKQMEMATWMLRD